MKWKEYAEQLLSKVCESIFESFVNGTKGVVAAEGFDTFIEAYGKICKEFVGHYLDAQGMDEAFIQDFRTKFMRVLKMSVIAVDEIDTKLSGGIVVDRWQDMRKLMRAHKRTEFIIVQKRRKELTDDRRPQGRQKRRSDPVGN